MGTNGRVPCVLHMHCPPGTPPDSRPFVLLGKHSFNSPLNAGARQLEMGATMTGSGPNFGRQKYKWDEPKT